jgi:GDP-D-mannose dehydratase
LTTFTKTLTAIARLFLHYGDLTDGTTLRRILEEVEPVEIYNLGSAVSRAGEL